MHPQIDSLPHLRTGWSRRKVSDEQIRYATSLAEDGVEYVSFPSDRVSAEAVAALNSRNIDGPTHADHLQGVAALDRDGNLIAAVTLGPSLVSPDTGETVFLCLVRYLAVEESWRRRGLATVLLCIMDQRGVPDTVTRSVFYGGCKSQSAALYQHAGFDVLQAGTAIPGSVLGLEEAEVVNPNTDYPCWFIRTWSQQRG